MTDPSFYFPGDVAPWIAPDSAWQTLRATIAASCLSLSLSPPHSLSELYFHDISALLKAKTVENSKSFQMKLNAWVVVCIMCVCVCPLSLQDTLISSWSWFDCDPAQAVWASHRSSCQVSQIALAQSAWKTDIPARRPNSLTHIVCVCACMWERVRVRVTESERERERTSDQLS